ncbi:MAG: hypothetical protein ACQEP5_08080 [Actinomycetota bacterium]
MKFTNYFHYMKKRPDMSKIKDEWIKDTINNPVKTEMQLDGRIRKWSKIKSEDKYSRVIMLEDGETVHNAFFDRNFKEE